SRSRHTRLQGDWSSDVCSSDLFLLVRVGHNDPVGMLAGPTAGEAEQAAIRSKFKLDQPEWKQFEQFVVLVAHGDLGQSWLSDQRSEERRVGKSVENVVWACLGG